MNSKDTSNNFNGIWDRDNTNETILAAAEKMAEVKPAVGSQKKEKPKRWGLVSAIVVLLLSFAVQTVYVLIVGLLNPGLDIIEATTQPLVLLISGILLNGTWILGMLYVSRKKGQGSFKKDFKVSFKIRDIFIGLGLAAALFGIIQLSAGIFTGLGLDLSGSDNGAGIASLEGIWFILVGIGMASILGPISEELFFRGMLLQGIINTLNRQKDYFSKVSEKSKTFNPEKFVTFLRIVTIPVAILISSVVFGFMHTPSAENGFGFGEWYLIIATGTLGLFFGIASVLFKRLGPVIYGHMFYNASTLILSVVLAS